MERLTGRKNGRAYIIGCPVFAIPRIIAMIIQKVVDRCADIEDILGDDYDLARLRELVEADRDGRCVVLPCKIGDTVYQADTERIYGLEVKKVIYDCGHIAFDDEAIGKTVFLTREATEDALKGKQNG